jgi:hypothetical protein
MTKEVFHPDYSAFLAALKERILRTRTSTTRTINRELVSFESIWRQPVAKLFKSSSSGQSAIWPQAVAKLDEDGTLIQE